MKRLILLALCGVSIVACRDDQDRHAMSGVYDDGGSIDTTSYPLFIDGGSKIVYQFGYMTPDKGLKLYFDTIPNPEGGLRLDGEVRSQLEVE